MSLAMLFTRQNRESPAASRADRAPIAPAIFRFARNALLKSAKLIVDVSAAFAEARVHRAMIEAELYRNRYRHSSKNDDDLPIVGPAPAEHPAPSISPRVAWRRAAGAAVAIAKRAYPAIIVLSLLATVLAATLALRLAIWLPLYMH